MLYCDTHVHCYKRSDFSDLLDRAYTNFVAADKSTRINKHASDAQFLMFFTDGVKDKTWSYISPIAKQLGTLGDWHLRPADDGQLIVATRAEKAITLAPARQINSANRLEFLLLGCAEEVEDGLAEQSIIDSYSDSCMVICPWGVGKWLGKRGKLLSTLIANNTEGLFLGDNGGRPSIWRHVPQFKETRNAILNGSDPLPIAKEINRVASFGTKLAYKPTAQDKELSLQSALKLIKTSRTVNYGSPVSLFRFVISQVKLLLK
jgi:hypothetical protein